MSGGRERYLELGIFPEDEDIPLDAINDLWQATSGLASSGVRNLIDELAELSLLAEHRSTASAIQLHDILRSYARHELGEDRRRELNGRLLDVWASRLVGGAGRAVEDDVWPWHSLPDDAQYLWRYICYHLAGAGRTAELTRLVLDLRRVLAKI